ncbi:hypothetical protein BH09ACT12_BH09ACT12_21460 [soil metagenome]
MTSAENLAKMDHTTKTTAPRAPDLDLAAQAADAAAAASGVTVREVADLEELGAVVELLSEIWGRAENPPVTIELLRALTKAGNYVGGAFVDDRLVGASVGFFHAPSEEALHSHIAGVSASTTSRSVGFAIKLHQRSWTLLRGVSEIVWTFDPLVRRNAHFNLVKLAAVPVEYLPNFYGAMADRINAADDSDRLLVRWPLRDPAVGAAYSGEEARPAPDPGAAVALGVGPDGLPVPGRLDAATSLVQVPADIESLRHTDPAAAHLWRVAVRDVLSTLVRDGSQIIGLDHSGGYVVRRSMTDGTLQRSGNET